MHTAFEISRTQTLTLRATAHASRGAPETQSPCLHSAHNPFLVKPLFWACARRRTEHQHPPLISRGFEDSRITRSGARILVLVVVVTRWQGLGVFYGGSMTRMLAPGLQQIYISNHFIGLPARSPVFPQNVSLPPHLRVWGRKLGRFPTQKLVGALFGHPLHERQIRLHCAYCWITGPCWRVVGSPRRPSI